MRSQGPIYQFSDVSVKVGGMRVVTHTKAHKEKPAEEEKPDEEEAAQFEE